MMLVQGPHFKKQWSTVISKLSLLHLILLILSLSSQQPKPKRDHNSPSLKIFLWFPSHLAWKNLTTGHRALYLWFSNFSVHQNHLEGLLNHSFLEWTPSFWFGMSGVGQWTLPNQFPGDADPAGTTWRTIDLHDLCPHPHSQPLSSASTTLSSLCLVTFYYSLLTLSSNMASSL